MVIPYYHAIGLLECYNIIRGGIIVKWLKRMQECIIYIEENLKNDIDMNELSKITFLSRRYFFRMFEAVTDISVVEYIRKRRMTLAASELMFSNKKVIDIALDYGYSSSESFSRAFKNIHGISPSSVAKSDCKLKSYPPLSFQIKIRGDTEMDYRIVKKEAFKVIGKSFITTDENYQSHKDVPVFWNKLGKDGTLEKLQKANNSKEHRYGICMPQLKENDKEFEYIVAVPYNGKNVNDCIVYDIPEATWVVFECIGSLPDALHKLWKRIFSEWLPATKYELNLSMPEIEFYLPGCTNKPKYYSEIWISISDR